MTQCRSPAIGCRKGPADADAARDFPKDFMLRKLYDGVFALARSRHATPALALEVRRKLTSLTALLDTFE